MSKIRILLAEDHGIVRKGLRSLLERRSDFEVVGEAANGREAVTLAGELRPDIVIMDIAMPLLNGVEATAQIIKRNPQVGIIILSMYSEEDFLVRALTAGAKGYLHKDSAEDDLVKAVQAVAQNKPFFSPAIAAMLFEEYVQQIQKKGFDDSYDLLTEREKEVLQLFAEGKTNKEVASLLDLSIYTVETHRSNLMQKLNLHSAVELVLYAVRKKIIA
jgi:two-component system, NarL family, response regulator NreC